MLKFQRNYRAEFEIGEIPEGSNQLKDYIPRETVIISYPFTCQFDIETGTYNSQQRGIFQFINLSRQDQARLWVDMFNLGEKYVYLKFYAGYGQNMPLLFEGRVQQCTSEKQGGSTEFITQVQAWAGTDFMQFGYLNVTVAKGTSLKSILEIATKDLKDIQVGYITPDIPDTPRNRTFIGQTMDLLKRDYAGYEIFVNKGELNILGDRDVVPGEVQVITDQSGLLGSPRRANAYVECDMIFEPQLTAGQAILLLSDSRPWMNQAYKIVKIHHHGVISPNTGGSLITTVTLTVMSGEPRELEKAAPTTYDGNVTSGKWLKPVKGVRISDAYGWRIHPITGKKTFHQGMDIAANLNTPVTAPANGTINHVYINGGYGKYIEITHGKDENGNVITSAYGHLNSWLVSNGQKISAGQQIGFVGSTGNSTGPHLHFEVRKNGKPVNPTIYIGSY